MPTPGKQWRHIIINTKNSWLHGDQRGFRDRDHRLHSSGDYNNPPPPHENDGIRHHYRNVAGQCVEIPRDLRPIIGKAIVENLTTHGHRLLVVSVSKLHAHFVVEPPEDVAELKKIVGWAKWKSSRAVTEWIPGDVWSAGETYKLIRDHAHLVNAVNYVIDQQAEGAWIWTIRNLALDERSPGAQPRRDGVGIKFDPAQDDPDFMTDRMFSRSPGTPIN